MKARAKKKKPTSEKHPAEAEQKRQIKTLRRVAAQRKEISRLLRQIAKLGTTVDRDLYAFALTIVEPVQGSRELRDAPVDAEA